MIRTEVAAILGQKKPPLGESDGHRSRGNVII